jgi:hypothetical protein
MEHSEVDGVQYITILPTWTWLMAFVEGNSEVREQALRAFNLADLLATLVDMGVVTQEDLQAARANRARA